VFSAIDRWLTWRAKYGFSEWNSHAYQPAIIRALLNIIDFAENTTLALKASMIMDLICFNFATKWFQNSFATSFGRAYGESRVSYSGQIPRRDSISDLAWILLGIGKVDLASGVSDESMALCTSTYTPPSILESIANDAQTHEIFEIRESQSFDIDQGEALGMQYNEQDIAFWWGAVGSVSEWTIATSQIVAEKYNMDEGLLYGDGVIDLIRGASTLRGITMSEYAGLIQEITRGITLERANIYTYRTPYYQMSGVQDHQKGLTGVQEHLWQASLSDYATVFTSAPGPLSFKGGAFMGGWHPRATFHKNVGVIQYDHEFSVWEEAPVVNLLDTAMNTIGGYRPRNHAYFPQWAFDDVRSVGQWTLGAVNGSYIGLYSEKPVFWANDYELASWGQTNCWIVEIGTEEEYSSFDDFVNKICTSAVEINSQPLGYEVSYQSPSQGEITVAWDGPMNINNSVINFDGYDRWDCIYSQTPYGSLLTEIEFGGARLILDFDNITRTII